MLPAAQSIVRLYIAKCNVYRGHCELLAQVASNYVTGTPESFIIPDDFWWKKKVCSRRGNNGQHVNASSAAICYARYIVNSDGATWTARLMPGLTINRPTDRLIQQAMFICIKLLISTNVFRILMHSLQTTVFFRLETTMDEQHNKEDLSTTPGNSIEQVTTMPLTILLFFIARGCICKSRKFSQNKSFLVGP